MVDWFLAGSFCSLEHLLSDCLLSLTCVLPIFFFFNICLILSILSKTINIRLKIFKYVEWYMRVHICIYICGQHRNLKAISFGAGTR